MSTQEIYNYRKVDDLTITGGQPTEAQLESAAREGVKTVINLATYHPEESLLDEAGLVSSLEMKYYPIPVVWNQPQESDFEAFERVMKRTDRGKTLIHCAANYRVTAFYSLYAMKHLGWTEEQADDFRSSIWQGSQVPVWEDFIHRMKIRISH